MNRSAATTAITVTAVSVAVGKFIALLREWEERIDAGRAVRHEQEVLATVAAQAALWEHDRE